jgi:hypothetical protein
MRSPRRERAPMPDALGDGLAQLNEFKGNLIR